MVLDDTHVPVIRWFVGGETNAAFNELDQPVLCGFGAELAFLSEPDSEQVALCSHG